jgi:hypothetical protein
MTQARNILEKLAMLPLTPPLQHFRNNPVGSAAFSA